MFDEPVPVLSNQKVNGKYYKLIIRSRSLARGVRPGQFLHLQVQPGCDPFLRRPFSYYRVAGDRVEILYEILGRGTNMLSGKKAGELLRIMGPLGLAFKERIPGKKRVLVAGGVGVPPLVFLAERFQTDYLLIGTKSKKEVLPKSELAGVRGKVLYSTNDGSYGEKGYVTELLEKLIKKESAEPLFIQTCGPNVMMQAVINIARREGIEGEASLDKSMACGVGACLGCMVKTKEGWTPSCVKGPVFAFDQLDPEADICD
jgi:dihydroorotate dehydrogenase electron transfer subunit